MPLGDDCCFCFFFFFSVNNVRVNYSPSGRFLPYDSSLTFCFEKKAWMVSDVFFLNITFPYFSPLFKPKPAFFEFFFWSWKSVPFPHKSPGDPGGADAEADAPAAPTETAPAGPGPKGKGVN